VAAEQLTWGRLAPILSVQFIGTLGFSIAIPFLVFLVSDLGGAAWTYGLVGATYSTFQLFGAPLLGRWSDRTGRKPVLAVSQGGTLLAWLLFLVALSIEKTELVAVAGASITVPLLVLFGARALDGLTGGNVSVASAYVADLTADNHDERQVAFGRMGMAASLGFIIGPALAGVLGATPWGYAAPVAAAAGISLIATLLVVFVLPEPRGRCPVGPDPHEPVTRTLHQDHKRGDRHEKHSTLEVLRNPRVGLPILATFVLFLAFNLFYASFPVHVREAMGWDVGQLGVFFSLLAGMMLFVQGPVLGLASKRLAPTTLFPVGVIALAGSFGCYMTGLDWAMYAGAALFAVGNGLSWPTFQALLADVAGDEDQGAVQGAATSASSLASIVGLVVGGLLYPALGIGVFAIGAALFGVVALGTPVWFRGRAGRSS